MRFIPTTVVGVGSSGVKTVEWLSRLLYQEFGETLPPFIRLVAYDSDEGTLHSAQLDRSVEKDSLAVTSIYDSWLNLKASHGIDSWFSHEEREAVQRFNPKEGAGGVRAVGRLYFWSLWNRTLFTPGATASQQPFSDENRRLASRIMTEHLGKEVRPDKPTEGLDVGHFIDSQSHVIYLIGSATGGTASGSIIDMAYAAAEQRVRGVPPKVIVVLTLPPQTLGVGMKGFGANAAATLVDVEAMVLEPEFINETVTRYPSDIRPTSHESPVNAVYLIGPEAPGETEVRVFSCDTKEEIQVGLAMTCAYWLFASVFGLGAEVDRESADYAKNLSALGDGRPWPKRNPLIRTFAIGGVARPTSLLAELVTEKLLAAAKEQWTECHEQDKLTAWKRKGHAWLDEQIDQQVGELRIAIMGEDRRLFEELVTKAAAEESVVQALRANVPGLHSYAAGKAREAGTTLARAVGARVLDLVDQESSVAAGREFLAGAEEALKDREKTWSSSGIDCSGVREATVEGALQLIRRMEVEYDPLPPVVLGGRTKAESREEAREDFCGWLAAYHLAPLVFAPETVERYRSVRASIASHQHAFTEQVSRLQGLVDKQHKRTEEIERLNRYARGTIRLVWLEEGDTPTGAADTIFAKVRSDDEFVASLRTELGKLHAFLQMTTAEQLSYLRDRWTKRHVLPMVTRHLADQPLHRTVGATGEIHTLLALNPLSASRRYFSPIESNRSEKCMVRCHVTAGQASPLYSPIVNPLLKDIDLKYEESVGFTLFDLVPLRRWLGDLLGDEHELRGMDPYRGVRRFLSRQDGLASTVVRFIRDLLIEWDAPGSPTGVWSEVRVGAPPLLLMNADGTDVVLEVGDVRPQSLAVGWRDTSAWLANHPRNLKQLLERLERALARTNRQVLEDRWLTVRGRLGQLYPRGEHPQPEQIEIQYGLKSPVGDLGHLIHG